MTAAGGPVVAELRAVASWRWPNYVTRIPPGVDLATDTARTLHEVVAEIGAEFPGVPVSEHVVEGPSGPALLSQAVGAILLVVGARATCSRFQVMKVVLRLVKSLSGPPEPESR